MRSVQFKSAFGWFLLAVMIIGVEAQSAAQSSGGAGGAMPEGEVSAADEVIPQIPFQEAPLDRAIKFLAEQAGMEVAIDPHVLVGRVDENGSPIEVPLVTGAFDNMTARQALDELLVRHELVLIEDPASGLSLVTDISIELDVPTREEIAGAPATPSAPATTATDAMAGTATPTEERIDVLPIGEMPLQQIVTLLAEGAKIDFVWDPELIMSGSTNALSTNDLPVMKFYNKTYGEALDAILSNHNLVLMPDNKTGIARITRRPPPQLEPLITEVVQLKYSSATNMADLVQAILETTGPAASRTQITADSRTSKLVVRATESELESITNLVAQLDTPTRQVLIEAKLLETSANPRSVKGIDWSGTLAGQNVTFGNGFTAGTTTTTTPGETRTVTLPSGRTITTRDSSSTQTALTTAVGNGGLSMDTARGLHPETAFLNADGVRAVLSFLNTEADTKVIATPRAVTLDNERARLAVTRAFPIFEITPGTDNSPPIAQVTYTNLGTILSVTPRIAANDQVYMHVVPEVSNIDSVESQILNGLENTANVYAIRTLETRVTIPSGNTLVMGGLISDTSTKSYTKVPILGDIPGLGLLFRRDTKERNKANLLIFVTPTIIEDQHFHPSPTDFLDSPPHVEMDPDTSFWNSGKPRDWKKDGK